ncbi:MAG: TfoX/Sxy family protein [Alphaproteobacteria bacterium]|nr:TfoX/Sxy family protein [Alphaproteobacteria bacterium]NNF23934.1 TfoX/Sxy family protein [Paracoccaceae bacterium]
MSVSASDKAFALELFGPLGEVTSRPMMGGLCLYASGAIFGILDSSGGIYLRAKGDFSEKLMAAGSRQFSYTSPKTGKTGRMGYWTLPDAALDDAEKACDWARQSLNASED